MSRVLMWVGVFLLALVPSGTGAPIDGSLWIRTIVPAGTVSGETVTAPGTWSITRTFKAGERACVIVIGDHRPIVDVEVKVYDSKERLVAKRRGTEPAPDFVGVAWYPPREEKYRIEVSSYGKEYNECSVAIK